MKVAVAQLAPGPDRALNVRSTVAVMREAARQGVQLLVLPELCISPYLLSDQDLGPWAEVIPAGDALQSWLQESATLGLTLVAGVLEREGDSFFNTAVCLGPQGIVARYRKAHLFGWERRRLTAGEEPGQAFDVQGARGGTLICYDLRFGEAVRLLALADIQLLCVPTTWTDVGKPRPFDRYGLPAAVHLALGHAYANKIYVLCAGRVGQEGDVRYLGSSLIAAPNGHVLAGPADAETETLLVADLEPAWADDKQIGSDSHVFADRRTDLYTLARVVG